MELSGLRRDFGKYSWQGIQFPSTPLPLFRSWIDGARAKNVTEFNAMVLSTVGQGAKPSSRIVLLKEITDAGDLVFYTNYLSKKGKELEVNPFAAVHFFWAELEQQIRVEGKINKIGTKKSDEYFYSRPVESQISAIVSPQSESLSGLQELKRKRKELLDNPASIKRPVHWGGYELKPALFEFWQGGKNRLHQRLLYEFGGDAWKVSTLAP